MKNVIMNLQHQEPQRSTHRTPSPPRLNNRHRSLTPPTHQARRTVAFAEPLDHHHHNNPPPTVFVKNSFFNNKYCSICKRKQII